MQVAGPQSFMPELRNIQNDGVLEPRGHDPAVTPMGIGRRLLEAQQHWDGLTSERLDLGKDLSWVERVENLHVQPPVLFLRH
jgi:hypothetical protein